MEILSNNERPLRVNAAQGSLISVRLEGLEPSAELIADFDKWTAGELTLDDVRERMFARFAEEDKHAGRG
jgi:hypothetical protein